MTALNTAVALGTVAFLWLPHSQVTKYTFVMAGSDGAILTYPQNSPG